MAVDSAYSYLTTEGLVFNPGNIPFSHKRETVVDAVTAMSLFYSIFTKGTFINTNNAFERLYCFFKAGDTFLAQNPITGIVSAASITSKYSETILIHIYDFMNKTYTLEKSTGSYSSFLFYPLTAISALASDATDTTITTNFSTYLAALDQTYVLKLGNS